MDIAFYKTHFHMCVRVIID